MVASRIADTFQVHGEGQKQIHTPWLPMVRRLVQDSLLLGGSDRGTGDVSVQAAKKLIVIASTDLLQEVLRIHGIDIDIVQIDLADRYVEV